MILGQCAYCHQTVQLQKKTPRPDSLHVKLEEFYVAEPHVNPQTEMGCAGTMQYPVFPPSSPQPRNAPAHA